MATDVKTRSLIYDDRVAFRATWDQYEAIAQAVGDQRIRLAYDGEQVELMSPSPAHELFAVLIECLVRVLAAELNLPRLGMGSTRWERPAAWRGLEADATFYLTAEKCSAAMKRPRNAADYPIPDLAIEIDISPSKLDRAGIYATLGVAEIWRFDGEILRIDRLGANGTYSDVNESAFLGIRAEEIASLLAAEAEDEAEFNDLVRLWAREVLVPRRADA